MGLALRLLERAALSADELLIDTTHILRVNGYESIQPQLFGLTAYVGCGKFYTPAGSTFLADHGIESVGLPGVFKWVLPNKGATLNDAAQIDALFADPKGPHDLFYNYAGKDRYAFGRMLGNIRYANCEPWLYLIGELPEHTTQKGRVPTDYDFWSSLALAYVKLWRTADPKLRYVHVMNEPNSHWYEDQKTGSDYAQFFAKVAAVLKREFPDIQVGGPVLCWPPTWPPARDNSKLPWSTWENYSKPLLAEKNLDFFDFHAYDIPVDALEGELNIITAQSVAHDDRWLASALTESNFTLTKDQWLDRRQHYLRRVVPMARQMFMLLRNPDKVFCQQIHDLDAITSGWYRFSGNDDLKVTPMEDLLAIFRALRGTRLVTNVRKGLESDIKIEAAFQNRKLTIAVLNLADKTHTIRLSPVGIKPDDIQSVHGQVLDVDSRRDEAESAAFSQPKILGPQSMHVWELELKTALKPEGSRASREFFAKGVMQPLGADQTLITQVSVKFEADEHPVAATLRIGIKSQESATGSWRIEVDGTRLRVENPGAFMELPLSVPPKHSPVTIKIERLEPTPVSKPPIVSFVSLMLQQER